mmetsp:Transcript_86492/g.253149  ORF Transcript_86492/g.253149 Transcript_86492/m.253149 type:complete len:324 (+) Transcript_86492:1097-2068(+)
MRTASPGRNSPSASPPRPGHRLGPGSAEGAEPPSLPATAQADARLLGSDSFSNPLASTVPAGNVAWPKRSVELLLPVGGSGGAQWLSREGCAAAVGGGSSAPLALGLGLGRPCSHLPAASATPSPISWPPSWKKVSSSRPQTVLPFTALTAAMPSCIAISDTTLSSSPCPKNTRSGWQGSPSGTSGTMSAARRTTGASRKPETPKRPEAFTPSIRRATNPCMARKAPWEKPPSTTGGEEPHRSRSCFTVTASPCTRCSGGLVSLAKAAAAPALDGGGMFHQVLRSSLPRGPSGRTTATLASAHFWASLITLTIEAAGLASSFA